MPRIQPHDHSSFNQGGLIRPPAGLTGGADPGTVPSGGTSGGPGVIHAVDVLMADTGGLLTATEAEGALAELATNIAGLTLSVAALAVATSPRILLADGRATPFAFTDLLQADDGSDFMYSDP